ncbi:MAG: hypothetical protein EPO51_01770 [Phenylobacterium sp.]|uniref:hypothetical protein n=1 Tax=Phenylobacterium sp. TaxID=1871053 RepID=UPI001227EBA9|nr:hypothetical protein [Phenylobacterium sp.]TAJ74812.1 MAG: hypothetical protein EPO51_01770 [Phenylobacterium sp.]
MISLVFAAALLAGAADPAGQAATAKMAAAPSATPTKATKADKTEMVCKREAVLGSRMKERVCMSQADWDQRKADSRADVEKGQSVKPLTF